MDDFCTEENYDQTSAYINHQLNIHGFSSSLQFIGADKHAASRIVTALYKILQQHLKDSEYKEEMDLNWRRLSQDYDTTLHNLNVTKTQLEKSERETDMLSARIAALEDEAKVETEKHRYTREELKSAKANLQYSKTQYAHESRKKEQEVNALKEKLQKSISRGQSFSSSSSTIPGGITILNPVPRSLHGKTHTNEAELLLKEVIEQQQAKENEIVEENEQLRRTLYTVQVELEGLLKKHSNLKNSSNNAYGLPFEMVKDRIETEIRDTLTLMSDQWNHRPSMEPVISPSEIVVRDQRIEDLQKEIEKLQLELEDSTLLVQGAQKMIDNLSSGNFLAGLQDLKLNVEGSDMTLQEIDEAEAKIRRQREDLAKERKRFTQACLDLGKEREELQQAKDEFEESKRTFRLDKVVDFLSFSPVKETAARTSDVSPPSSVPAPAYAPTRGRAPVRAPPSPTPAMGAGSRKRVATSPLPYFSTLDNGRSVRPKTKTTVIEVPDDDDDEDEQGVAVPEQGQVQEQWRRNQNTAVSDEDEQLEEEEEDEQLIRTNNHNNIKAHKATKDSFPTFGVPGMPRGTFGSTTVAGAARVGRLGSENQTTTTSVIATADGSSLKPTTTLGSSTPGRSRPSSTFTTSTPTPFVISFNDPSLSTPTPRPQTLVAPVTSSMGSSSTLAAAAKSQPFNFTATLPPNTTFKSLSSRPVVSASAPTSATAVPTLSFNPRINNNDKNSRPSTTTSTTTPSSSSVPAIATSVQFPSLNASVRMPSALTKAAAHLASRKAGITAAPSTSSSKSGASLFSFTDTRRATESGPDSRSGSVPSSIFSRRPKA
ncbi:Afadin and alpha-actinin-binding-domain-containing protein [Linnemannia elongata]|nr:Afadin and alpha-actinin-binding-domain-containing protein [Linnemannia elongata]